jgi:hypothetical protein
MSNYDPQDHGKRKGKPEIEGQEILFGRPPAQRHSATSKAAASAIEPKAGTLRGQVLACIRAAGLEGRTDEECQEVLGMNPSTQRPRRIELQGAGLIVPAPGVTRKTTSGRKAKVFVAIGAGA